MDAFSQTECKRKEGICRSQPLILSTYQQRTAQNTLENLTAPAIHIDNMNTANLEKVPDWFLLYAKDQLLE